MNLLSVCAGTGLRSGNTAMEKHGPCSLGAKEVKLGKFFCQEIKLVSSHHFLSASREKGACLVCNPESAIQLLLLYASCHFAPPRSVTVCHASSCWSPPGNTGPQLLRTEYCYVYFSSVIGWVSPQCSVFPKEGVLTTRIMVRGGWVWWCRWCNLPLARRQLINTRWHLVLQACSLSWSQVSVRCRDHSSWIWVHR